MCSGFWWLGRRLSAGSLIALILVGRAEAVTKVFTGGVSNAWSNANNWSPPGVPLDSDDVSIPAGKTVMQSPLVNVANLEVNGTIYGGQQLRIFGELTWNGGSI